MIDQLTLCSMFDYSEGVLIWKISPSRRIKAGSKAGTLRSNGRYQTCIKGKIYFNHRIIFMMHKGYVPDLIDHADGNPMNNKIENLREATQSQNMMNCKNVENKSCGIRGVTFFKKTGKWKAQMRINGAVKHLGYFDDVESARFVVETARNKHHGEFARHN